jgi:dTDP-glucose 4,6-dehydratase
MKIVYVTGCLGFIGSYVTRACLQEGWHVRGVDKITYAANTNLLSEFNKHSNFTFEQTDICDIKFLYECDYIINVAAETHVGNSIINSKDFIHSNVTGVWNLLELLRNYRAENKDTPVLFHFSTDEVYGDVEEGKSHTEESILNPSNPYSASKAAADQLVLAWSRTYDIPYIILRPANNYGIGQYVEKLIPRACKLLSLKRKLPLHNRGKPKRVWLHAADTANAVITIINKNIKNEIFNISGDLEQTNRDTIEQVLSIYYNRKVHVDAYCDFTCDRAGQDFRYSIDDSKLESLGWKPRKIFEKELPHIVNYYRNHFIW